ncbi:hypothetical protein D3C87_1572270 [compost metagenome]
MSKLIPDIRSLQEEKHSHCGRIRRGLVAGDQQEPCKGNNVRFGDIALSYVIDDEAAEDIFPGVLRSLRHQALQVHLAQLMICGDGLLKRRTTRRQDHRQFLKEVMVFVRNAKQL